MSLVVKQIDGVWMVKGSADLDRDYQTLLGSAKMAQSAGGFIDILLRKYPGATIQILGEDNVPVDRIGLERFRF